MMKEGLQYVHDINVVIKLISNTDIEVIKKRHIFYMWSNFYNNDNSLFSTFYKNTERAMSSNYDFFIEHYVKYTYSLHYSRNQNHKLQEYVDTIIGEKDDLIRQHLDINEVVPKKSFFKRLFSCCK